jgi:molybdenum cofactor cytidylyltransferase
VVLAAGGSSRMGRPKQLAELAGRPLLEHTLAALASPREDRRPLDRVLLALGSGADQVLRQVDLHGAIPVTVGSWAQGMGHVLATVVARHARGCDALVVLLGDQPLVGAEVVARLVAAWQAGAGPVVGAAYHGRPGNPKLFDRSVLGELTRLRGDSGARELLAAHPGWVRTVEVGDLGDDADVDDEEGLARVRLAVTAGRRS